MLMLCFVLGLILLTQYFNQILDEERNPNQDVASVSQGGIVEVILERNRYGHYVANGTINGRDVEFFVDTGATHIAVPERLANELGLKRGYEVQVSTANGLVTAYQTRLERVSLGEIVLENVKATIVSGLDDKTILLGMSFLGKLEMVQKNDRLMLRQG